MSNPTPGPVTPAGATAATVVATPPTSKELFLGFLGLGMTAFGGALPLAHRMVVERKRWLSEAEFVQLLGLCQFLPGGNIINLSVALGMKFRGIRGALAAIFGLIAVPSAVVVLLGMIYQHFQHDPNVRHLFAGLAAAAAGLLIQMAVKIALPLRKNLVLATVALVCFVAIAVLRIPLVWVMLVMTPVSVVLTARFGDRFAARPGAGKADGKEIDKKQIDKKDIAKEGAP